MIKIIFNHMPDHLTDNRKYIYTLNDNFRVAILKNTKNFVGKTLAGLIYTFKIQNNFPESVKPGGYPLRLGT